MAKQDVRDEALVLDTSSLLGAIGAGDMETLGRLIEAKCDVDKKDVRSILLFLSVPPLLPARSLALSQTPRPPYPSLPLFLSASSSSSIPRSLLVLMPPYPAARSFSDWVPSFADERPDATDGCCFPR